MILIFMDILSNNKDLWGALFAGPQGLIVIWISDASRILLVVTSKQEHWYVIIVSWTIIRVWCWKHWSQTGQWYLLLYILRMTKSFMKKFHWSLESYESVWGERITNQPIRVPEINVKLGMSFKWKVKVCYLSLLLVRHHTYACVLQPTISSSDALIITLMHQCRRNAA